ncbi:MAG: hypothetical protein R3B40_02860 [Polyangiales bacterium]
MTARTGESRADRVWLGVALLVHTGLWYLGTSDAALDVDVPNLCCGMVEFDVTRHCPHPPGYLVYTLLLRALHALRLGADAPVARIHTAQLLSLSFALGTIALTYVSARRVFTRPSAAGWAALLVALHPLLLFHSVDAQSHTSEAFAAAALGLVSLSYVAAPSYRRASALGILLALGASFRPSFIVFGVPFVASLMGVRRFNHLVVTGAVSVVGAAAWLLPTFALAGGYEVWSQATNALVRDGFLALTSPLSTTSDEVITGANLMALGVAAAQLLAPPAVAWLLWRLGGRAKGELAVPLGPFARAAAIAAACTFAYYSVTFFSEPGYVLALLPACAIASAATVEGPRVGLPALVALLVTLTAALLAPQTGTLKMATLDSWQVRHAMVHLQQHVFDEALATVPPDSRVLYVTDSTDITLARQMPLLRDDMDVLLIQNRRHGWSPRSRLNYVTRTTVHPVPTDYVLGDTGATSVVAERPYDFVLVDNRVSTSALQIIAEQLRCPLGRLDDAHLYQLIPVACFREPKVQFDGLALELLAPNAPR